MNPAVKQLQPHHSPVIQAMTYPSFSENNDSNPFSHEFIYVIGQIKATFNNTGLEREFRNCWLQETDERYSNENILFIYLDDLAYTQEQRKAHHDNGILYSVLSKYPYIARDMEWTVTDNYNYSLYRIDAGQHIEVLIDALAPRKEQHDAKHAYSKIVLGHAQQTAHHPLPLLKIIKLEDINAASLAESLARQFNELDKHKLNSLVAEVLSLTDNSGDSDTDRAVNYMVYHNPEVYRRSYRIIYGRSSHPSDVPLARLNNISVLTEMHGKRKIARVIFDFHNTQGGGNQYWYSAIDVTDDYPFLLTDFKRYLPCY